MEPATGKLSEVINWPNHAKINTIKKIQRAAVVFRVERPNFNTLLAIRATTQALTPERACCTTGIWVKLLKNAAMMVMMTGCGSSADSGDGTVTIGISQFAEHGSLDNCREGFLEGLSEAGFVEGENLVVDYQNAYTDMGTAGQISNGFVSDKVDLICAIATPTAQSAYNAAMDSEIPVIYTAVTDPIAAELADAEGNVCVDLEEDGLEDVIENGTYTIVELQSIAVTEKS